MLASLQMSVFYYGVWRYSEEIGSWLMKNIYITYIHVAKHTFSPKVDTALVTCTIQLLHIVFS